MVSMLAAAVSAALAVYVAVQAARGVRAPVPAPAFSEDRMASNERRDGRWICACTVPFCLFLAAFACYIALAPEAAEAMEAGSNLRLAALSAGGLILGALSIRETKRLGQADSDSELYHMREVPMVYAALLWSALFLGYAIALA